MKRISILFIAFINVSIAAAQWSNTTNVFADSLHMPVCTATGEQNKSMSLRSYPDSGYIVYWEDARMGVGKTDIYAQKFDKTGHALWAANGVPIATGTNRRHFTFATNGDYRNNSYAATDSSGGFYIGYLDDSVTNYTWQRVAVQHIRSDGTAVFPGEGFIAATTPAGQNYNFDHQQLIADGNKGFYLGFLRLEGGQDVYAFCYRDEGGTMKYYGGGQMDANAYLTPIGACSNYTIAYRDALASDFYIYPDLQGGCNVTMTLAENAGGNERQYTGYNRLVRIKKASIVNATYPDTRTISYPRDSVVTYYQVDFHTYIWQCGDGTIGTGYILDGNGYLRVTDLALNQTFPKGIVVPTSGNVNADIIAMDERRYFDATGLTPWYTRAYFRFNEKYDSIPYQYTVFPFRPESLSGVAMPGRDSVIYAVDTILNASGYGYYDFSMARTGNDVYVTAAVTNTSGLKSILLQKLELVRTAPNIFTIQFPTGNTSGVMIGKEVSTGFGGTDISYDTPPQVIAGSPGNALFYINENGRGPRVSPIINTTELAWGAMGKPIGAGRDVHGYYYPVNPFVTLDPFNGTGILNWDDGSGGVAGQGENISMLHLDSLNLVSYSPAANGPQALSYSLNYGLPVTILGTSHAWTTIETLNTTLGGPDGSAVQILDNYNLGAVQTTLYKNIFAVRSFNGVPYLDRNITIRPENNPAGTASISLRLFFTNEEFAALQTADPSILNPGFLSVLKQPNSTTTAPSEYVPAAGEEVLTPSSWKAVSGGYYIELTVTGFSNFFIQKGSAPLPVTWLGVQAQWEGPQQARVSWQVADQENIKDYTVQHSLDGNIFADACSVDATGTSGNGSYACIAAASEGSKNFYRILQRDLDGKARYSKVVTLQSGPASALSVYPNPAKERLYISGLNDLTQVNVIDIGGRTMSSVILQPGTGFINVSKLAGGIYFIRFTKDQETQTIKFIKE
ncbi:MAG TPA: T9SS type A sorting domain-containing protein [Puia sp.]|nr:T9SS type A sorting domain-containing protein [Puia sp.]